MKVIFDESAGEWRESDKHLFRILVEDRFFQEAITEARHKLKLKKGEFHKNFINAQVYIISQEYADIIINTFDLHKFWKVPIAFFIATNKAQTPGDGIYISGLAIPLNPIRNEFLHPDSFELTVVEKMGFENLVDHLIKNKEKIKKHLNKLPRKRNEVQNLEMRIDIKKLCNNGKTIDEIYDYLIKNYDHLNPDKEKIRNWIKRNEQYLMGNKIT